MNIGFIGVGHMGGRMARRLLEAGYSLTVHDLRKRGSAASPGKGGQVDGYPQGCG